MSPFFFLIRRGRPKKQRGRCRADALWSYPRRAVWPFGYLVRLFYPLLEGRYEVDGMTAIVCRGTGTWGPRMRLWRPGEILRVTLRVKEK